MKILKWMQRVWGKKPAIVIEIHDQGDYAFVITLNRETDAELASGRISLATIWLKDFLFKRPMGRGPMAKVFKFPNNKPKYPFTVATRKGQGF